MLNDVLNYDNSINVTNLIIRNVIDNKKNNQQIGNDYIIFYYDKNKNIYDFELKINLEKNFSKLNSEIEDCCNKENIPIRYEQTYFNA